MENYGIPEKNSLDSMEGMDSLHGKVILSESEIKEMKKGEYDRAWSVFFHDETKELNIIEDSLYRYTRQIQEKVDKVSSKLESLSKEVDEGGTNTTLAEVRREILELKRVPNIDFMLRQQFMSSHIMVVTEGRYYQQPKWCTDLLESGTKSDIYLLLRALVWLPQGYDYIKGKGDYLNSEKGFNPSEEWRRLFVYGRDEEQRLGLREGKLDSRDTTESKIAAALDKIFYKWNISKSQFESIMPPPDLNPGIDFSDKETKIIWNDFDINKINWLRTETFFPLFIYALRTAFEHAFAKQLLRVLDCDDIKQVPTNLPETIILSSEKGDKPGGAGVHHLIHLDFPALGFETGLEKELTDKSEDLDCKLPYDNWIKHRHRYRNISEPWKIDIKRVSGSLGKNSNEKWHYRLTLSASE